jgi:hypothetical protein
MYRADLMAIVTILDFRFVKFVYLLNNAKEHVFDTFASAS